MCLKKQRLRFVVSVFRHVEAMPKHRMVGKMFKRFFAPLRMTEFSRAVFLYTPRPFVGEGRVRGSNQY